MWIITGGAYQGKLTYALNLTKIQKDMVADGETCTTEELMKSPMINKFHLWVKRMLEEDQPVLELVGQISVKNPNIVIIMNELGCGVVPMDAKDRLYRETVGRVGCNLAQSASQVHLVLCGIGTVIKHD